LFLAKVTGYIFCDVLRALLLFKENEHIRPHAHQDCLNRISFGTSGNLNCQKDKGSNSVPVLKQQVFKEFACLGEKHD